MEHVACKSFIVAACAVALFPSVVAAADTPPTAIVSVVERICLPLIRKQPIQTVASATGLTQRDGGWTLSMEGSGSVRVTPPSASNPTVCMASVAFERANRDALRSALAGWAGAKHLSPVKAGVTSRTGDLQYRTSSWSGPLAGKATTVVFTEQTELDGRPIGGDLDEAVLLVNSAS